MPRKPKRLCRYPGCRERTDGVYCAVHERIMRRHYDHFTRGYDQHERYGGAWRKIRDRYLAAHPLCERCYAGGKAMLAVLVLPIADVSTNDESNPQSLCASCHEKLHKRKQPRA